MKLVFFVSFASLYWSSFILTTSCTNGKVEYILATNDNNLHQAHYNKNVEIDHQGYNEREYNEGAETEDEEYDEEDYDDNEDEADSGLDEDERLEEYHKRGYQWPLPDDSIIPNVKAWKDLNRRRIEQVSRIENTFSRYQGLMQMVQTSIVVPNFTEHGFGLARCADEVLMKDLRDLIRDGIATARLQDEDIRIPGQILRIDTRQDMLDRVLSEMHSYAETWSNMELIPSHANGFRIYRNESKLQMHYDTVQAGIISMVLHIGSSDDSEPWPLFVEDYNGNTHEVRLTSGDILFFESSKLIHGRPKPFSGSWYSSVFVYYRPIGWDKRDMKLEVQYAVPPMWHNRSAISSSTSNYDTNVLPKLVMASTTFTEPDCLYEWCATEANTIKWGGPAKVGEWIAPTFERYPFYPKRYQANNLQKQNVAHTEANMISDEL